MSRSSGAAGVGAGTGPRGPAEARLELAPWAWRRRPTPVGSWLLRVVPGNGPDPPCGGFEPLEPGSRRKLRRGLGWGGPARCGGGEGLVIPRHFSQRWSWPAGRADTFRPNAPDVAGERFCIPLGPEGHPGGGHTRPMLRAWPQGVARPRMHNLLLVPRPPPTPSAEPVVMFCLRRASFLGLT